MSQSKMASKEFRSPAHPEPPRQRLTSPWTLLGVAAAVLVTLVLIFPGSSLMTQRGDSKPSDVKVGETAPAPGTGAITGNTGGGGSGYGAPIRRTGSGGRDDGPGGTTGTIGPRNDGHGRGRDRLRRRAVSTTALQRFARVSRRNRQADLRFSLAQKETDAGKIADARAASSRCTLARSRGAPAGAAHRFQAADAAALRDPARHAAPPRDTERLRQDSPR